MIFEIPVSLYRTIVYVLIDVTDPQAKSFYKKQGGLSKHLNDIVLSKQHEAVAVCDDSTNCVFIRFGKEPSESTVAHEFLHATFFIADTRGLQLDNSSEEAYTYLLGYLIGEYYKKIRTKT